MTKQEIAIKLNMEFKDFCKENSPKENDLITAENMLKAAIVLKKIYNYQVCHHKPLRHTIEKYIPPKFVDKFILADIIEPWTRGDGRNEFFVIRQRLNNFIDILENTTKKPTN